VKVLVVEDEQGLREGLARGLEAEGFVVQSAANGVDGLWMAQEFDPAVVVLDIMLPGLSGYEVCRRLRQSGSHVPILMLTAKDGEYDEADALDLGADDFLSKPFSYVVLLAHLRALLRRAPSDRAPELRVGDLRLDPATRRCFRGSQEVALTPREFALAELLVRPVVIPACSRGAPSRHAPALLRASTTAFRSYEQVAVDRRHAPAQVIGGDAAAQPGLPRR